MEISLRQRLGVMSIVKLIIVLSLPLVTYISFPYVGLISLLFVVGADPFIILAPIQFILLGLLILLPGLIFERQLNSRPITQSIRKRAVAACVLSWLIGMFLPLSFFVPFVYLPGMYFYYYSITQMIPLLTISFYVVLPLLSREVAIRSVPSDPGYLTYGAVKSLIHGKTKRVRVLLGLLWANLMFFPFMVYTVLPWWSPSLSFISLLYQVQVSLYDSWFGVRGYAPSIFEITQIPATEITLAISMISGFTFLFFGLLSALRFVFVRDIFRFKDGLINKGRLVSVAMLGEILPAAVVAFLMLNTYYDPSYFPVVLPIPLLPIAGFIFIRFSRLVRMREEIWPEQKYRMWYEKEQEPYTPAQTEESITVPISYLLLSQVRKRLRE